MSVATPRVGRYPVRIERRIWATYSAIDRCPTAGTDRLRGAGAEFGTVESGKGRPTHGKQNFEASCVDLVASAAGALNYYRLFTALHGERGRRGPCRCLSRRRETWTNRDVH